MAVGTASSARPRFRDEEIAELARRLPRSPQVPEHDRLAQLPSDARSLVEALAVLGSRVPLRMAATVAGLDAAQAAACALDAAMDAGLVSCWPDDPTVPVAPRHALDRDLVYAQLSLVRRRRLHAAAAQVVTTLDAWRHRAAAAAGAPDARLAAQLEIVAVALIRDGRHQLAATHLGWAAQLSAERADQERRLVRQATELVWADRIDRLGELRDSLAECAGGPAQKLTLSLACATTGQAAAARRYADQAWRAARPTAGLPNRTAPMLPLAYLLAGVPEQTVESGRWLVERTALDDPYRAIVQALVSMGVLVRDGPVAALASLPELPERGADRAELVAVRGILRVLTGELSAGAADLQAATWYLEESVPLVAGGAVRAFAIWAHMLRGQWAEAEILVAARCRPTDPLADLAALLLSAARGDRAGAARLLAKIRAADPGAPGYGQLCVTVGQAVLAQAGGDRERMYEVLAPLAGEPPAHLRYPAAQIGPWWLPLLAEAQIGTGRYDEALTTLARLDGYGPAVYLRTQVAALRAWLYERRGEREAALTCLAQVATVRRVPDDAPLYRALAQRRYARLAGHERRATEALRAARATLLRLGAVREAELCEAELAMCGTARQRVPERRRPDLTDREREVVRYIALGMTNKEISTALYVSVKTIEFHLGNIYVKLGVKGRRAVRELVQEGQLPG